MFFPVDAVVSNREILLQILLDFSDLRKALNKAVTGPQRFSRMVIIIRGFCFIIRLHPTCMLFVGKQKMHDVVAGDAFSHV